MINTIKIIIICYHSDTEYSYAINIKKKRRINLKFVNNVYYYIVKSVQIIYKMIVYLYYKIITDNIGILILFILSNDYNIIKIISIWYFII